MNYIASWITLASFIVSAVIIVVKHPSNHLQRMIFHTLTGFLCAIGGLLLTGFVLKFTGPIANPLIPSTMTLLGALCCVSLRLKFLENHKEQ